MYYYYYSVESVSFRFFKLCSSPSRFALSVAIFSKYGERTGFVIGQGGGGGRHFTTDNNCEKFRPQLVTSGSKENLWKPSLEIPFVFFFSFPSFVRLLRGAICSPYRVPTPPPRGPLVTPKLCVETISILGANSVRKAVSIPSHRRHNGGLLSPFVQSK
jgi:hypothetical protein